VAVASGNNLAFTTLHHGRDARIRIKADSTAEGLFGLPTTTSVGVSTLGVTGDVAIETYGRVTGSENTTDAVTFTVKGDKRLASRATKPR
jgi:hypothetical protein